MIVRLPLTVVVATALVLSSCGGSGSDDDSVGQVSLIDPIMDVEEPEVAVPDVTPTELVVTDITAGSGPAAAEGDTIFVYYVGVLTVDGTRFDGNYGADPFGVTLGQGAVIAGWDRGLIGLQAGGRRQLDIPADLAYGEQGAGSAIPPNSALSFVIDAVAVIPAHEPTDEPNLTISATENVSQLVVGDLREGTGAVATVGSKVVLQLLAFRADNGEKIASTWASPQPLSFELSEGGSLPGVIEGMEGMKVGGRRQLQVPFAKAWGPEGQANIGLPPETDVIIVIDLLATF